MSNMSHQIMNHDELKTYLELIGGVKSPNWRYSPSSAAGDNFTVITDPNFFSVDCGWYGLIKDLINELIELGWDKEIHQVKEKFGGLRFYVGSVDDAMQLVIRKYENRSYETCEVCGVPGQRRPGGWVATLCDTHFEQRSV